MVKMKEAIKWMKSIKQINLSNIDKNQIYTYQIGKTKSP